MSRVVIAEDDPDLRALYSRALTRQGHSVVLCGDGSSAYDHVRREHPDLLLTDVDMPPGMNGLELAAAVHADPSVADIPILLVTGGWAEVDDARTPGVVALLRKPFSPRELVGHVEAALAGAPARSAS
ncbi:response regulator [Planosporangium thailandense]|uniref:Response regulator n=1 Tax=Planosporangium thailandense TaxID=765197 RepID=A0ABX0Y798_9ACTN|nr:response regulator [Planosporangium thailandense]NJC74301.1 response regulator [Planosporangium thailandense]